MPKKEPAGSPAPKNTRSRSSKDNKDPDAKGKEVIINIQPFDPAGEGETPATNSRPRRTKTMTSAKGAAITNLTLTPPKNGMEQLQAQSSSPAPRKATSRGSKSKGGGSFHKTDKLPAISPGGKQEIYGILLIAVAAIFFFGLFAS